MRADKFLTQEGHYESRAKARVAIEAGLVMADGEVVSKPSQKLSIEMVIEAGSPHPWVSRAGLKLAHALDVFSVNPTGQVCLDVGSSTGGFTDVLLAGGAAKVYAVDVGTNQLHKRIRAHPNVVSMEQTDSRNLAATDFATPPSLIVCDVSFISCMKALDVPLELAGALLRSLSRWLNPNLKWAARGWARAALLEIKLWRGMRLCGLKCGSKIKVGTLRAMICRRLKAAPAIRNICSTLSAISAFGVLERGRLGDNNSAENRHIHNMT